MRLNELVAIVTILMNLSAKCVKTYETTDSVLRSNTDHFTYTKNTNIFSVLKVISFN